MNHPSFEKVILWGEQRITQINRQLVLQGDIPMTELYWRQENLNGQTIARRRYQGFNERTEEIQLAEDVYFIRANDFAVITLSSRESSFEYFTDEFERIVTSFSSME